MMGINIDSRLKTANDKRERRYDEDSLRSNLTLRDENTATRYPWYLGGLTLLILSPILQQPILIIAGLLLFIIGSVPEIWYRFGFAALVVERELSAERAELGSEITLALRVENRKLLPLPWVELVDELPEEVVIVGTEAVPAFKPLRQVLTNEMALLAFQRVVRRYHLRCVTRGAYTLGPMLARSSDPFGLLTRERSYPLPERLIVYPLVVPIERLGLPARALLGENRVERSLLRDPVRIAGVRPYQAGDDPRRLHWKASARTGALQSKVLEPSAQHTLALIADLRTEPGATLGYDPALVELLVTTVASVAQWGFDARHAVGVLSNGLLASEIESTAPATENSGQTSQNSATASASKRGDPQLRLRIPPSAHPSQALRVFEGLARLLPYYSRPITDVLAEEESRFPLGTTVVYCGAAKALSIETCAALERLRRRGHAITLLLVGDEAITDVALPVYRVGTRETWSQLLDEALALHGLDLRGSLREVPEPAPNPHLELEVAQ